MRNINADVTNEDTVIDFVSYKQGKLKWGFYAKERSKDTSVVQASAFKTLVDNESFAEYVGPKFFITNGSINCIKSVGDEDSKDTVESRNNMNYVDPAVTNAWIRKPLPPGDIKPQLKVTTDAVYFYCEGHNMTVKNTTVKCPAWPLIFDSQSKIEIPGGPLNVDKDELNLTETDEVARTTLYPSGPYQMTQEYNLTMSFVTKADNATLMKMTSAETIGEHASETFFGRTSRASQTEGTLALISVLLGAVFLIFWCKEGGENEIVINC